MPELPEVETIARGLAPGLIGRVFLEARPRQPSVTHVPTSWKAFSKKLAYFFPGAGIKDEQGKVVDTVFEIRMLVDRP